VRSRCKRQLIRLNMKKKWPTRTGMEDSRPIFFCKRFSYNENALYPHTQQRHFHKQSNLNETVILQNPPQMHRQGGWSALTGP